MFAPDYQHALKFGSRPRLPEIEHIQGMMGECLTTSFNLSLSLLIQVNNVCQDTEAYAFARTGLLCFTVYQPQCVI